MCFNYSALIGKIIEKYGNRYAFAYAIGLSERSLSLKLNNKVSWKDKEIAKACELLSIPKEEIQVYFLIMKFKIIELKTSEGGITVQDLQNKPNIGEMFNIQEKKMEKSQSVVENFIKH